MSDLHDTIKRMAKLAKLSFPEQDLDKYAAKAQAVLTYVEKLNELDTEGITPTFHAVENDSGSDRPLREDQVVRWRGSDEIINSGFVRVPKVIE